MHRDPAPGMTYAAVLAALADDSDEKIARILSELTPEQIAELHGKIGRLAELLEERHTERRERRAGKHRKPGSTVPEDYSFHDGGYVVRGRDTGDEPLGPPADYT